jgi:hypothetical protein
MVSTSFLPNYYGIYDIYDIYDICGNFQGLLMWALMLQHFMTSFIMDLRDYGMKHQSHVAMSFHHPHHELTAALLMHVVLLALYYTI